MITRRLLPLLRSLLPDRAASMSDPTDLPGLSPGQRVQDPLLILEVERRGGDTPHTVLTFANASGRISSAPFWLEDQPKIAGLAPGDVAQVIGEVALYRGQRQLKVSSIRPLPKGAVDLSRLVPSIGDPAPYWKTLDGWRAEIVRPRLAATLDLFYRDDEFRLRYEACPASLAGHHALLGGLLKHTVEVASIARAIARACRAEADLVLAGVLLHDIGKLDAYRWDGGIFEMTEAGTLHGHVVLGALAPRPAGARRGRRANDAGGRGPALRRQRERQDGEHGGGAGGRRQLRRRGAGQHAGPLATRPASRLSWPERLGRLRGLRGRNAEAAVRFFAGRPPPAMIREAETSRCERCESGRVADRPFARHLTAAIPSPAPPIRTHLSRPVHAPKALTGTVQTHLQARAAGESRKCLYFFGLRDFLCGKCGAVIRCVAAP